MKGFTYYFFICTCLLGIACAVGIVPISWRYVIVALVLIAVYLGQRQARCPRCHRLSVDIRPFSKNYGSCKDCHYPQQ